MDNLSDLLKQRITKKAPAYPWQDLALRVIQQIGAPAFKRGAVFKICKELPPHLVERALNDTKELCQGGMAWKYFFKIADQHLPAPIKKISKNSSKKI